MTGSDLLYFDRCRQLGLVGSPFLEVGAARVEAAWPNLCQQARQMGIRETLGIDLSAGPGVDETFDFSIPPSEFTARWKWGQFATVALFNVLEHTFDPARILRNAASCVSCGGTLLVLTPVIWPLHDYPKDYLRLLPHWFEELASREGWVLNQEAFCWVSQFGIKPVHELIIGEQLQIPCYLNCGHGQSPLRYWVSRLSHRFFNTYGRSHWFTHVALGAVFHIQGCARRVV